MDACFGRSDPAGRAGGDRGSSFRPPYYTVDEPADMVAGVAGNLGGQSMVVWLGLIAALTIPPAIIWIGRLTYYGAPKLTISHWPWPSPATWLWEQSWPAT